MKAFLKRLLDRYLFAPTSDKVTKSLLLLGAGLVALPSLDYLIIELIVRRVFGLDLTLSYPTIACLVTGGGILTLAVLHNVLITRNSTLRERSEIDFGHVKLTGYIPVESIFELATQSKESEWSGLDYSKIREHFQPKIFEAVHAIDRGEPEKGGEILRSIINQMPLGVLATLFLNYGYYCSTVGSDRDVDYYRIALRIYEDSDQKDALPRIYINLGESSRRQRQFGDAESYYLKAITVADELSDRPMLAGSHAGLGLTYGQQCRHQEAEEQFHKALAVYDGLNSQSQIKKVRSYLDTLRSCPKYTRISWTGARSYF